MDILVNTAGFGMYGSMENTQIEDARHQFELNLFGLARLTQLVLPAQDSLRRREARETDDRAATMGR